MKILITTDWYAPVINGVVTSVLTLKEELQKMGHEVRVATLSESGWPHRERDVYYLRSVPAGKIYPGARAACLPGCGYGKELSAWKPDLIHSQCEFSSFLFAGRIAGKLGIPIVHTYHTVYEDYTHYFCPVKPWGKQAAALFSRMILDKTERVIAPTDKVKKLLVGYGVTKPIDVIPTGIRTKEFLPESWQQVREERDGIRKRLGIREGQTVLLSLGRLAREKNLEEVITCFGQLHRKDMELVIVGDGPHRKELEALASGQDGHERIHFAGMVSPKEVPAWYHAGDLFVCASNSETQGITYLEALSAGLPVVCREDPCVEGIVRNRENGYRYHTPEELQAYCCLLADDRLTRNLLSAQAVRTGLEYDSKRFGEKVVGVYRQALDTFGRDCAPALAKTRIG